MGDALDFVAATVGQLLTSVAAVNKKLDALESNVSYLRECIDEIMEAKHNEEEETEEDEEEDEEDDDSENSDDADSGSHEHRHKRRRRNNKAPEAEEIADSDIDEKEEAAAAAALASVSKTKTRSATKPKTVVKLVRIIHNMGMAKYAYLYQDDPVPCEVTTDNYDIEFSKKHKDQKLVRVLDDFIRVCRAAKWANRPPLQYDGVVEANVDDDPRVVDWNYTKKLNEGA